MNYQTGRCRGGEFADEDHHALNCHNRFQTKDVPHGLPSPCHCPLFHRLCCCCRPDARQQIPLWLGALYHWITTTAVDFCKPGKNNKAHRKGSIIMLHNSATTCGMSESSSFSSSSSFDLFSDDNEWSCHCNRRPYMAFEPFQAIPSCRGEEIPLLSPSSLIHRQLVRTEIPIWRPQLLVSSSPTTSSIVSGRTANDYSRHRRSNHDDLPTPEQIFCHGAGMASRMKQTTTRGVSSMTQLTMPSLSNNNSFSESDSSESLLDLSESDGSRAQVDQPIACILVNNTKPLRHFRNLSYCSSSSEQDTVGTDEGDDKSDKDRFHRKPRQKYEPISSQGDWTLDWLTGNC